MGLCSSGLPPAPRHLRSTHRTSPPRGWSMDASTLRLSSRASRAPLTAVRCCPCDHSREILASAVAQCAASRRRASSSTRSLPRFRARTHDSPAPLPRVQVVGSSFDGVACTALTTLGVPGATTTATGARARARPDAPTTHDSRTRRAAARPETDTADTIASDERAAHELAGDGPTHRCAPRPVTARATATGAAARAALQSCCPCWPCAAV